MSAETERVLPRFSEALRVPLEWNELREQRGWEGVSERSECPSVRELKNASPSQNTF